MVKLHTLAEKDTILRIAFKRLVNLGISPKWGNSTKPYTELREECEQLMTDANFAKKLNAYLQKYIVLGRASEMFAVSSQRLGELASPRVENLAFVNAK